jgi:hypothetical protein
MSLGSTGVGYKILLFVVRANFLMTDLYDNIMRILFGTEAFDDAQMRVYNERVKREQEEEGEDATG